MGFNSATTSGPLCEEPMQGVCFIIDNIEIVESETEGPMKSVLDQEESKVINTSTAE